MTLMSVNTVTENRLNMSTAFSNNLIHFSLFWIVCYFDAQKGHGLMESFEWEPYTRDLETFSIKSQMVNILGSSGLYSLSCNYSAMAL